MELKFYQLNAFTDKNFKGNPAGVCPLIKWLPENIMQKIALENNLSETAFFVKKKDHYEIRWFTPETEVDICGHATLASAYVIFNYLDQKAAGAVFHSRSGKLQVWKEKKRRISMLFPAMPGRAIQITKNMSAAIGLVPVRAFSSHLFLMLVLQKEEDMSRLKTDMKLISGLSAMGLIVTAPGKKFDFVSRFFAPKVGIPEDPVTGSAHCMLVPYWSDRLKKKKLSAKQVSKREGILYCQDMGEIIKISGNCVLFSSGTIHLEKL